MKSFRGYRLLAGLVVTLCTPSMGGEPPEPVRFWYSGNVGSPLPATSVPGHVVAPNGELTLFADYGDVVSDAVRLYLVNRTQHRIGFSAQDGDVYVKLEAGTEDGRWERAQTHHHSWCGNSYDVIPALRPGEYFRFAGYFPSDGEPRTVRYRMYRDSVFILDDEADEQTVYRDQRDLDKLPLNLASNVGMGKVRLADLDAARRDGFALALGTFEVVRDLVTGTTVGASAELRHAAVGVLGRFPIEESFALVRGLLVDPDQETAAAAMRALARMGLGLEAAERLYQELLRGDDIQLRASATRALTERPVTPEVIRFAKEQLSHDDLYVRVFAMSVLGRRCKEDPEMKAFINSIYDDPDPKIQSVFETVLFPTCIRYQERGRKGQFRDSERR